MDDCQRAVPLRSGGTVVVQAWGLGHLAANASDFLDLLAFYGDVLSGRTLVGDLVHLPEQTVALLERMILSSLVRPEDHARVRVNDLGDLITAIFELNDLDGLLKNLLGLRLRMIQAAQPEQASSTPPTG